MSTPVKPPAYQWYVNEWRGSRAVHRMTYAQRGMYREMLDEQWDAGSLPDDPRAVAELLGGSVDEWMEHWPVLRRKFVDRRARPRECAVETLSRDYDASRRIVNLRLEKQRKAQKEYKAERSAAGRKGGLSNARRFNELDGKQSLSTAKAEPQLSLSSREAELKPSLSSSSSSSTSVPEKKIPRSALTVADGFSEFWQAYPKRKDRASAEKAWRKLAPDPEMVKRMLAAIAVQRESFDWQKDGGQFIPYPATWLNARRWEDEAGTVAQPSISGFRAVMGERRDVLDADQTAALLAARRRERAEVLNG